MEGQDMFVTQTFHNFQENDSQQATMQQSSQTFNGNFQANPQLYIRLYESKIKECQLKINLDSPRTRNAINLLKMPPERYTLKNYTYFEKIFEYEEKQARIKNNNTNFQLIAPQNQYFEHLISTHSNLEQIIQERLKLIKQENVRLRKTAEGSSRRSLLRQPYSGDLQKKSQQYLYDKLNIDYQLDKVNNRNDKEYNLQEFEMNNELKNELDVRKTLIDSQMSLEKANEKKQKFLDIKLQLVKKQNQKVAWKQKKIKNENAKKMRENMKQILEMYQQQEEVQKRVENLKFKRAQDVIDASHHEKELQAKQKSQQVQEELNQKSQKLRNYIQLRDQHVLNQMSDYWSRKMIQIQEQNNLKLEKAAFAQQMQQQKESQILQKVIQNYESHSKSQENIGKKTDFNKKTINFQNQQEEKPLTFKEREQKYQEQQKLNQSLLLKSQLQQIQELNSQWNKKIESSIRKQEQLYEYQRERQSMKSQSAHRNSLNHQSIFQSTQDKWNMMIERQQKVKEKIQKEKQDKEMLRTFSMQSTLQIQHEKERRQRELEKLQKLTPIKFVQQLKVKKFQMTDEEISKYFPEAVQKEMNKNENNE